MSTERWRPIPGYERFEVSTLGRVRRADTGRLARLSRTPSGYLVVCLSRPGASRRERYRTRLVHGLVLAAFVGPRPAGEHGCHGNGIRHDNRLVNLRWDTPSANERDKFSHGTKLRGLTHPQSLGHGCIGRALDLMRCGLSERAAARWLGVSRRALRKHLAGERCERIERRAA